MISNLESVSLWRRIFQWGKLSEEIQSELRRHMDESCKHASLLDLARQEIHYHKSQAEEHRVKSERAKAGNKVLLRFVAKAHHLTVKALVIFSMMLASSALAAFPSPFVHNLFTTNPPPLLSVGSGPILTTNGAGIPIFTYDGGSITNLNTNTWSANAFNWVLNLVSNAALNGTNFTVATSNALWTIDQSTSNSITRVAVGTNAAATTNGVLVTISGVTDTNAVNGLVADGGAVVSNGITPRIIKSLGITIDGGGSAITSGTKGYLEVPAACTVVSARIVADQSGSIAIETWRTNTTVGNFPPTRAGALFTNYLGSASSSLDSTLTGNTGLSLATQDILGFNVTTNALSCTRVTLQLRVQP